MENYQRLLSSRTFSLLVIACLTVFSLNAAAVTYTWVDEKGARHYSDKVPAKYRDKATVMGGKKANVMQSTKVPRRSQRYKPPATRSAKKATQSRYVKREKTPNITPSQYSKMSCNQQWRAFGMSEQCFSECAGPRDTHKNRQGLRERSFANCGHCTDLKSPSCKRR